MSAIPIGGARARPDARSPIWLSHFQAAPLLRARKQGAQQARTSVDLNLTMVIVKLTDDGITLADGRSVAWHAVEEAASSENACFELIEDEMEKVQAFSEVTDRVYTLYPTPGAPT